MKTYNILFAENVPHYGTVSIEAEDDETAIAFAKEYNYDGVRAEAYWPNGFCRRIVDIRRDDGEIVEENISLDD